jgi:hypothetical protein
MNVYLAEGRNRKLEIRRLQVDKLFRFAIKIQ